MVLKETPIFETCIEAIATEEEYRKLQNTLIENPETGNLIRGGGGIRKVRMAAGGKGKSGGARVIYYYIKEDSQIYLLLAYSKSESENLTKDQISLLKEMVKNF